MTYPLITKDFKTDAVILGNGDYPANPILGDILKNAKFLCCCDDAGRRFIQHGGMPDAIVGDGDSLPDEFKERYKNILHLIAEQDSNDQTKSTRFCAERGYKDIAYLGATGLREDHTLGNITLLISYLRDYGVSPTMITNYGYFTPAQGENIFKTFKHQQVSIFNFGCTSLRGEGLVYELSAFTELWQGTLNEAQGDEVKINGDGYYMVYRTFEPKI